MYNLMKETADMKYFQSESMNTNSIVAFGGVNFEIHMITYLLLLI